MHVALIPWAFIVWLQASIHVQSVKGKLNVGHLVVSMAGACPVPGNYLVVSCIKHITCLEVLIIQDATVAYIRVSKKRFASNRPWTVRGTTYSASTHHWRAVPYITDCQEELAPYGCAALRTLLVALRNSKQNSYTKNNFSGKEWSLYHIKCTLQCGF